MFPKLHSIERLCTRRVLWPKVWEILHSYVPPGAHYIKGSYIKGSKKSL